MKAKACRYCKKSFIPRNSKHILCCEDCAIEYASKQASKREVMQVKESRKEIAQKKQALKTRSDWLKDAQKVFNQFIRLRDGNYPCISCGRFHTGQYHAGHYRSVGSSPHLRFCELNCHKQCSVCNNHLSGNIMHYRTGLIQRIGTEALEWLESNQEPKHYTIDDIKTIIAIYKRKVKELQNESH